MSIVGAKKKSCGRNCGRIKKHNKKKTPTEKKVDSAAKNRKTFLKNAHSENVGACKKKKIVGRAHTFFIKFWSAHNTHTPTAGIPLIQNSMYPALSRHA